MPSCLNPYWQLLPLSCAAFPTTKRRSAVTIQPELQRHGEGMTAGVSRGDNPHHNTAMESFMTTYKREDVTLAEAATDFFA